MIPSILAHRAIFLASMEIKLLAEKVELLPQKALWFKARKLLLVADLHFGKINHFRKSGIPVPAKANDKNTELLINILNQTNPERIVFLGDLFHSHYNEEWEVVGQIRKHFSACSFEVFHLMLNNTCTPFHLTVNFLQLFQMTDVELNLHQANICLLYTSPSPRD